MTDAPTRPAKRAKHDWPAVRLAYLNGQGNLTELAQRFKVPMRSLTRVSTRERWRSTVKELGAGVASVALQVAKDQAAQLSLPARSAKLRDAVVTELERDAAYVATTKPRTLALAAQRQGVIGQIVQSAKVALEWGAQERDAIVRIDILSGATLALVAQAPAPPAIECQSVPLPQPDSDKDQ